ncbi:type IV pilin protein [Neisseria iguanae]|uniref:Type IV pilin protein n=1 Tax=Neisseria iguanae TaxID=90242 RepID=A0A2P7U2E4_9NEIS|nr:type IV pilin protein [Neisseria iguanae]PSJ81148.1 type IV pilin protein [Neisseria iguanae]
MKTRQSGFNLIELLIAIVILALLATIAIPSFQSFIRNTRLANVRSELAENAKNLERYYTQKGTFVGFTTDPGSLVQNPYFTISFDPKSAPNPSDSGFVLKATPIDRKSEPCSIYMSDSGIFWAAIDENDDRKNNEVCPGYEEPYPTERKK